MPESDPFGSPPPMPQVEKKKKGDPAMDLSGLREDINSIASRMRMNEERHVELRKKFLLIEQNMLSNHKKAINEIKTLNSDIKELKRAIAQIEDRILALIKELKLSAKKEDVDVIQKYVDLWQPVKFITAEQVEKIVEEKLEELSEKE